LLRQFLLIAVLGIAPLAPAPAQAQWPPAGVPLCASGCGASAFHIVADGEGGAFILWRHDGSGTGTDIYMQRVTADGVIAPGWPADGLPVCAIPGDTDPWGLIPDGLGGVIALWQDRRGPADLYAQRVQADGTLAPGWSVNGARVSYGPGVEWLAGISPDGTGGAFVAWEDDRSERDVYAQRITAAGAIAPGWPLEGVPVCTAPGDQGGLTQVVADDVGGCFVIWADGRRGGFRVDLYAQRLDATGGIVPGWLVDGVLVMSYRGVLGFGNAASDGMGGFIVAASHLDSTTYTFDRTYWAQRMLGNGERAPGWPAEGIAVCIAPDERDGLFGAPDRRGGLLLSWYDYRPPPTGGEIYAARITPDGWAAGWTPDGTMVSDDQGPGVESVGVIAPDGGGGAYIVWERQNPDIPSFIQHLDSTGAVASGWPDHGIQVAPTTSQLNARITEDGRGGAIVVWWGRGIDGKFGAYAKRFGADGPTPAALALASVESAPDRVALVWQGAGAGHPLTVYRRHEAEEWRALGAPVVETGDRLRFEDRAVLPGERYAYRLGYFNGAAEHFTAETWVEVPPAHALSLAGFTPNPALGAPVVTLSLSAAGPATLELLDIGGRRISMREVGSLGAGRHRVRLDQDLPPGIYLVRLRTPERTLITRAAIVQ
jgi:hypothetical protein